MPDRAAGHRPELLTITEATEVLRTPVATLRYWRHLSTGPCSFRLGRRVCYRRDDLHALIDARREAAVPTEGESAGRDPDPLTRAAGLARPAAGRR
jgi:hypothetical protein